MLAPENLIAVIVLPAIALSLLALDVRRERRSRPPQTTVLVVVGLNYRTAQIKLRDANLNIRILAERRGLPLEPGTIIAQTPQGGERVDWGTVIGVTLSRRRSLEEAVLSVVLIAPHVDNLRNFLLTPTIEMLSSFQTG